MELLILNQLPAFRIKSTATNYHTEKPELSGHASPQNLKRLLALHDPDERSDFKRNSGTEGILATLMEEHEAATTEDEGQSLGEPRASLTKRNEQDDKLSEPGVELKLKGGNNAKIVTDEEHLVGEAVLGIPTLKDIGANEDSSDQMTRQETEVNVDVGVDGVEAVKKSTAECGPDTKLEFNHENSGMKATSSGSDGMPVERSQKTASSSIGMMLELDRKDVACSIVELKSCPAVTAKSIDRNADDHLSSAGDNGQLFLEMRRKSSKQPFQAEDPGTNEGVLQQSVDVAENREVKMAEGFQDVSEAPSGGSEVDEEGEVGPLCDHGCPSDRDEEGNTTVASSDKSEASKNVSGQSVVAMDSNQGTTSEARNQVSRVPTTSSLEEKVAGTTEDGQSPEKLRGETGEHDDENESADQQPEMRSVHDLTTSREVIQAEVSNADVLGAERAMGSDVGQLVPNVEGAVSTEKTESLEAHRQQVDDNLVPATEDTRVQFNATIPKVGNPVISVDGQLVSNNRTEDSKELLMNLEVDGRRLEKMDTNRATLSGSTRAADNSLISPAEEISVNCAPAGQLVFEVMRQGSGEQADGTEVLGCVGFNNADKAVATLVTMTEDIPKASNPEAAFPGKDCTLVILDEGLLARKEEGTEGTSNLNWHGKVRLQSVDAAVCAQSFLKQADVQIADDQAVTVGLSHATSTDHDGPSTVGTLGEACPSDLRKFGEEEQVGLQLLDVASTLVEKKNEAVAADSCITDGEELARSSRSLLKGANVEIADCQEGSIELGNSPSIDQAGQSAAGEAGPSDVRKYEEEEQVGLQMLDDASKLLDKVVAAAPCITAGEELVPIPKTEARTEPSSNLERDTKVQLQGAVASVCTNSSLRGATVEILNGQEGSVELPNSTSTIQDEQSAVGTSAKVGSSDMRKFEEEEQVGLQTFEGASTVVEKKIGVHAAQPCSTDGEEQAPKSRTEAGTDPASNLESDTKVQLQSTVAAVCTQSSLKNGSVDFANGQEGSAELSNGTSTIQNGRSAAGTSGEVCPSDLRTFGEEEQVELQILEGASKLVEKKSESVAAAPCITDGEDLAPNSRTETGTDPASNLESDTKERLQSIAVAAAEAPQSRDEKELSILQPPETIKVYVRRRNRSSPSELAKPAPACTQTTTQGKIHHTVNEGWSSPMGVGDTEVKNGDASEQKVFKHYTRRLQSQTKLHNLANAATMTSIHQQLPKMETPRAPGKGNHFVGRARGRQARFVKKGKDQAVRGSSKETGGSSTDKITSSSDAEMRSTEKGSSQPDDQLDWLPEGWKLEVKAREAGSTAGTRDKYYHDPRSGHRFRSKNEVLQYLEYGKLEKWRSKTRGLKSKSIPTGTNTKTKTPIQSVAGKPSVQSAPANFSSTSTPAKPPARITPKATASQRNSARMKTTPMAGNSLHPPAANGATPSTAPLTWAPIYGPNGPIWLPWGGPVGQVQQNRVERQESDAGAPSVSEGGAKGSQLSSPAKGVQPPATGAAAPGEEIKDQGEQENRGKLIFRLKRKQPDPESGKGRSKRPMYEVVHREKASSSASTDTQRDKQTPYAEGAGQEIASCVSTLVQEEKHPSIQQPLSTNVSQEVEPPGKKRTREFSIQTSPGNLLGEYAPADYLIKSSPEPPAKRVKHQRAILPKWTDGQQVSQQLHQHLHQLSQQTPYQPYQHQPYTALGIPATASASGLQQMGQFNATRVFLPPLENSIPLSWQYPFSQTGPNQMPAAPVLNLGPFPSSAIPPSAPVTYSTMASVPIPNFDHFPGPAPAMLHPSTSSLFPCSDIGTGCTERDPAKSVEGIAHAQRFSGSKALTKVETSKLLEGLGRRILSEKLRGSTNKDSKFSS